MNNKIGKAFEKTKLARNTAPKIISLIFAIVFWVYVMDQVNPEIVKVYDDIPVMIVGVEQIADDGLVLMGDEENFVNITVAGRRNDLLSFDESLLVVTADIRGYQKGLNTVPIDKRVLADSVTITDISKSEIKVELDQIVSLSKPIELETTGILASGLEIKAIEKDKVEVVVSGPETTVNRIVALHGELNITEIADDFETQISLIPVDLEGNQVMNVELLEPSVHCDIDIDKVRNVPIIANFIATIQEGYQLIDIDLTPSNVLVKGDVETVSNLRSVLTSEIDLSLFTTREQIEVTLNLPDGVATPNLETNVIADVQVEKIETKEFIFDTNEIAYANLSDALEITVLEAGQPINLILKDISSRLEQINRADIELTVDLETVEPGIQELPISVLTSQDIKTIELSKETIRLSISEKD